MAQRLVAIPVVAAVAWLAPLALDSSAILDDEGGKADAAEPRPQPGNLLEFASPLVVDPDRAGGEPVVLLTQSGRILIAAHPGSTHLQGPSTALANQNGQVNLWRSTDGGFSFQFAGLPGLDFGPRDFLSLGISDPDLAQDASGRIYLAQLGPTLENWVSWSEDDGATWATNPLPLAQNDTIPFLRGDRPWIAGGAPGIAYLASPNGARLYKTTDGARTWTSMGLTGVFWANIDTDKRDGTIYIGGSHLAVSTDGGRSFVVKDTPGANAFGRPAIDADGGVYLPADWRGSLSIVASADRGDTWIAPIPVESAAGVNIWPWLVAGAPGRVAMVWLHADDGETWFVESAIVHDAFSSSPEVFRARVTPEPVHVGPICIGTTCQLPEPDCDFSLNCEIHRSDRRMGDFFTAAAGPDGRLHVAVGTTTFAPEDGLSRPLYIVQIDGPDLWH